MKAITICQPYAELIASGVKRVENRTWSTSYRGELAIHAGKSRAFLDEKEAAGQRGKEATSTGEELVFGAVVAVVRLAHIVARRDLELFLRHHPGYEWLREHEHFTGPIGWVLEEVRRVEPVYCSGKQGIWEFATKAGANCRHGVQHVEDHVGPPADGTHGKNGSDVMKEPQVDANAFSDSPYPTLARIVERIRLSRLKPNVGVVIKIKPEEESDLLREAKADWEERKAAMIANGQQTTELDVEDSYRRGQMHICGVRVLPA